MERDALIAISFTHNSLASEIFPAIRQRVGFPAIASQLHTIAANCKAVVAPAAAKKSGAVSSYGSGGLGERLTPTSAVA
jgi:hypothetical protein